MSDTISFFLDAEGGGTTDPLFVHPVPLLALGSIDAEGQNRG